MVDDLGSPKQESPPLDLLITVAREILNPPPIVWDQVPDLVLILAQLELYRESTFKRALRYAEEVEGIIAVHDRETHDLSPHDELLIKFGEVTGAKQSLRRAYLAKAYQLKKRVRYSLISRDI